MKKMFLLVLVALASACVQDSGVEVSGRIYVTGNEPFTQVAVETPEGSYCLTGADELWGMQGETLTIRGRLTDEFCRTTLGKTIEVEEFE